MPALPARRRRTASSPGPQPPRTPDLAWSRAAPLLVVLLMAIVWQWPPQPMAIDEPAVPVRGAARPPGGQARAVDAAAPVAPSSDMEDTRHARGAAPLDAVGLMWSSRGEVLGPDGDLQAARRDLQAILTHHPDDADALDALAQAEARLGRLEAAVALLRRACEASPDGWVPRFRLAGLLALQGDWRGAHDAWLRATELAPSEVAGHFNLGVARERLGDLDGAVSSFTRAIALAPRHAWLHRRLADCLTAAGYPRLAGAALETYLRLAPDAPDVRLVRARVQALTDLPAEP